MLKGALMLAAWGMGSARPTRDIDLLAHMENRLETLAAAVRAICMTSVEPDGLVFAAETVSAESIITGGEYEGVRVTFSGTLGTMRIAMRIDFGFGDTVVPSPVDLDYPTLLDFPSPQLRGYTRESAISEKLHAMVRHGLLNSRLKDFYDIWLLAQTFTFAGRTLSAATQAAFATRGLPIAGDFPKLVSQLAAAPEKQVQWSAFLRRSLPRDAPEDFALVLRVIDAFLGPLAEALAENRSFTGEWTPPGPWH